MREREREEERRAASVNFNRDSTGILKIKRAGDSLSRIETLLSDYASESKFAALFISRKYGTRSTTMHGISLLVNPVRFTRSCIERTF